MSLREGLCPIVQGDSGLSVIRGRGMPVRVQFVSFNVQMEIPHFFFTLFKYASVYVNPSLISLSVDPCGR
jgi:hypothetical protein